ncbi:MAG TPA: TonB-dependent siderophore receptor [Opitutaceae bacterium]|nr:TonB-dependent siderophore receptor [Opitutaceae bacterium]
MKNHPHSPALARLRRLVAVALLGAGPLCTRAQFALAEAYAQAPTLLDTYHVRGEHASDDAYRATTSTSATKTDLALQDTPQSISVVTADQIRDQQMTSLADVAKYVPGITSHQGENNRDQIVFRGNSSSADFFLNGVRDDVQYYRDLYNLARVEVLRGPNAMIFGRGGGGGVINRVTKEAEFTPLGEVSIEGGSFDARRGPIDLNQPLAPDLAFRVNAMLEDSGSFRRFVTLKRKAVNPTFTWLPAPQTKVTVSYEYLHDTRVADRGITSFHGRPADVPIETYYGDPTQSHVNANVNLVTASLEHRRGALTIRDHLLYGDYDRGYQNLVPGAATPDGSRVTLTGYNNATWRRNVFNQTDLTLEADTGPVRHTLLGGLELGRQTTENYRNTAYFDNTATSITVPFADPQTTVPVTWRQSATDANNDVQATVAAVYAQDQLELTPRLRAIAGARFDVFDLRYHNHRTGGRLARRDTLGSPRAGLIYKPVTALSLYSSYAVSYLPSSGDQFSSLTTITEQAKPEAFTNYEAGAKWEARRDLGVTLAVYQLDRTNTRATDPNDPTRLLQTGSQRTRGLEFGLTGAITKAWTVSGGYAYQDAHVRSATVSARAGATVALVPRHSASLWNRYQLTPRLGVGLGAVYRSDVFAGIDNTVTLPGYTEVDAALFYAITPRWRLQVNVENVLNRRTYLNADNNTNISPGAPRSVRVGMEVGW